MCIAWRVGYKIVAYNATSVGVGKRNTLFCVCVAETVLLVFFFNWDSLHARLNSHYEAWSYKKKKKAQKRLQATENPFRKNLYYQYYSVYCWGGGVSKSPSERAQ